MNPPRTVRFSEQPTVSHSEVPPSIRPSYFRQTALPEKHNDALYSPYDVFTAASLGNFSFIEKQLQKVILEPVVQEQLNNGFYPDRLNSSGWSPLMYAAYLGHGAVCSLLLDHNTSIDITNFDGQTALMMAAACGNLQIVQLLANKGASLDKQDLSGNTALSLASLCSHNQVVEFLLERGADPNIKNKLGMTPTLIACTTGHEGTLFTILQHGGDIHIRNDNGEDGKTLVNDPKILAIIKNPPQHLNLENKYYTLFKENGIDLEGFLKLTEKELNEIGVKTMEELQKTQKELVTKENENRKLSQLVKKQYEVINVIKSYSEKNHELAVKVLEV
ncbi:unnamed protein product [Enterobius vermicularis]|uniref:ANK_REP_REGION domain-containing protein n=1 Tax=Enterobius vermicularis TaxID=51028 RepID=A0A0N4V7R4_ENTVE|nr:unnamed protein product [Enterobius vermicularis]